MAFPDEVLHGLKVLLVHQALAGGPDVVLELPDVTLSRLQGLVSVWLQSRDESSHRLV